jgi:hypothetical protein
MNHAIVVPYVYTLLSYIIGTFTVTMAVMAVVRLRPSRHRRGGQPASVAASAGSISRVEPRRSR